MNLALIFAYMDVFVYRNVRNLAEKPSEEYMK